jgi:integrase
MLHVSLVKTNNHGTTRWSLYEETGHIEAFDVFQEHLLSIGRSYETRRRYSHAVANFIDYLYEINVIGAGATVTNAELSSAITNYVLFLQGSQKLYRSQLEDYANRLKKKPLAKNSYSPVISAINNFLYLCQHLADEACSLANIEPDFNNIKLVIQQISGNKGLSTFQRRHLIQNTVLGGVIRTTKAKLTAPTKIAHPSKKSIDSNTLDFPVNRAIDLFNAAKSFRDKAFYALLAASGLRSSEARSILMSHIDTKGLTVRVDDTDCIRFGLNSRKKGHRFKGRETSRVFLIEPFKTLFFQYFVQYVKKERINSVSHNYVFQCLHGEERGKPFKDAADSTINDAFHAACRRADIYGHELDPNKTYTIHSLRHMYGIVLLNYFHLENGQTFRLTEVQHLMGHKHISSTQKYARQDSDLLAAKMEWANEHIMGSSMAPEEMGLIYAKSLREKADKIESAVRSRMSRES